MLTGSSKKHNTEKKKKIFYGPDDKKWKLRANKIKNKLQFSKNYSELFCKIIQNFLFFIFWMDEGHMNGIKKQKKKKCLSNYSNVMPFDLINFNFFISLKFRNSFNFQNLISGKIELNWEQ